MRRNISNRTHWIEMRQEILAKIIASKPNAKWTDEKMAEAMRGDSLVAVSQPNYSATTARRDWLAIRQELHVKRIELADKYISHQLELSETMLDDLVNQWEEIDRLELPETNDQDGDELNHINLFIHKVNLYDKLGKAIERVLQRQSMLVPVQVPKKVEIKSQTFNLDMYLEAKQKAALTDENVIEGDFDEIK